MKPLTCDQYVVPKVEEKNRNIYGQIVFKIYIKMHKFLNISDFFRDVHALKPPSKRAITI